MITRPEWQFTTTVVARSVFVSNHTCFKYWCKNSSDMITNHVFVGEWVGWRGGGIEKALWIVLHGGRKVELQLSTLSSKVVFLMFSYLFDSIALHFVRLLILSHLVHFTTRITCPKQQWTTTVVARSVFVHKHICFKYWIKDSSETQKKHLDNVKKVQIFSSPWVLIQHPGTSDR